MTRSRARFTIVGLMKVVAIFAFLSAFLPSLRIVSGSWPATLTMLIPIGFMFLMLLMSVVDDRYVERVSRSRVHPGPAGTRPPIGRPKGPAGSMNDGPMIDDLTGRLKAEARRLGFDLVGIAPAVVPPGYGRYLEWLEQGREAGMAYLRRQAEARGHPRHVLEGARSVVVVGMIYGEPDLTPTGPTQGKVARYARGGDYHEVLWRKLDTLLGWLRAERPGVIGRGVCDSAPLLERDFARLAGLGWIGKNTCLIDRRAGSFTVLGAMLIDLELAYDSPFEADHCGTCTRCLDACPTGAFDGPYRLDARRCISYWTIEHRGPIPDEAADRLDGWAFGCDVCQDVCPWNRKARPGREPALGARPEWSNPDLIGWLEAEPAAFSKAIKGTALARSKRTGLLRNAALILGTRRVASAVPALIGRLGDADAVVRGASAWALGRIGSAEAVTALRGAVDDPDPAAREAVRRARESLPGGHALGV